MKIITHVIIVSPLCMSLKFIPQNTLKIIIRTNSSSLKHPCNMATMGRKG